MYSMRTNILSSHLLVCMVTSFRTVGQGGSSPLHTTKMKKRKYYRLAERLFPEEKDRRLLAILAEGLRKNNGEEPSKEEMGF